MEVQEVLNNIAGKLGVPIEEVEEEFKEFAVNHNIQMNNAYSEDELSGVAVNFFYQNKRDLIVSLAASPAISVRVFVTGVTKLKDDSFYTKDKTVANYKVRPNPMVGNGTVNEYRKENGTIIKKSFNLETRELETTIVDQIPTNSILVKDVYIVLRDTKKESFGKPNLKYGQELPLHTYKRLVFGIALIGEDYRFFTLTLKNKNATNYAKLPTPGLSYDVRVINSTKDGDSKYTFYDSPTATDFKQVDWNPFNEGCFMENVMKEEFMEPYVKNLIDIGDVALKENDEKKYKARCDEDGTPFTYEVVKFNSCLFVPVDLVNFVIYPPSMNKSSRVTLDFGTDFIDSNEKIIGWLSDKSIDGCIVGEHSSAIICCYPRWVKSKDSKVADTYAIDVYGILPASDKFIAFDRKALEKINSLDEDIE